MRIGLALYAAATAALGATILAWDGFSPIWQPVPPELPGYHVVAVATGALLLACSIGILVERTSHASGWMLAAIYAAFAAFWAVRAARMPHIFGVWGGLTEQVSLVIAAFVIARRSAGRAADRPDVERVCIQAYGACAVIFGLNHFFALGETAGMVPRWLPPGGMFWAVATGACFMAAGLAVTCNFLALPAARLLGAMMAGIDVLVWLPQLRTLPGDQTPWAGNGISLALAGAALVVGDAIARRRTSALAEAAGASSPAPPQGPRQGRA